MAGFSGGFWEAGLQKKYGIAQQEANSGTTSAAAGMMNAQTNRMLTPAQIAEANARAGLLGAQTGEVAADSAAERAFKNAQSGPIGLFGMLDYAQRSGSPELMAKAQALFEQGMPTFGAQADTPQPNILGRPGSVKTAPLAVGQSAAGTATSATAPLPMVADYRTPYSGLNGLGLTDMRSRSLGRGF